MEKWELARYLIDAKKCVDSILYISEHSKELRCYGLKDLVDEKRNTFYINCCAVLDNTVAPNTKEKKKLRENEPIIELLYSERDKNSAHKDDTYIPQQFDKIVAIAEQMKEQIKLVRELCKGFLPENITLDFVPHDKALFRAVHKILADDEEDIKDKKYPCRGMTTAVGGETKQYQVLNDTLELRGLSDEEKNEYAVLMNNGINFYEGIQERQDSCIRLNLLGGGNAWCRYNEKFVERHIRLKKLGVYDDFDIPQPLPKDLILQNLIFAVLAEEIGTLQSEK